MLKYRATAISAMELCELQSFAVVIAQHPDGSGIRVEIQRGREFDEQDRRLGHDTYCVCTERGAVHYGGIASWSLVGSELQILLDAAAATELGVPEGFLIELESDAETRKLLKEGLRRVLNGAI